MLSFRSMELSDVEAAYLVEQQANTYPWTKQQIQDCLLSNNNPHNTYECWVCCLDGRDNKEAIVGYGVLSTVLDEISLLNICVATEHQGQGYGREFLLHLLSLSSKKEAVSYFLEVRASNHKAIKLYESEQFEKIAVREAYYPSKEGREDALIYRRVH